MPRACCDCAVATPSEPACESRPGGGCVDEVACPVLSLAAGGLRSGERDRLPFLPRRGMAEKIKSRNYSCVKFCGQLIPATYAQVSTG